jgi:cytoskeleton protein RodZ
MPGIGETLREARMRRRIDMAEVETATKIRAKYLRALENEEWSLLPGTTFVKTFLRTYAEYLELDSRSLVEEYKQRFERPGPQDLLPFSPRSSGRRQRRGWGVPPFAVVTIVVVLLLGALYALGQLGDSSGGNGGASVDATATPSATPAASSKKRQRAAKRKKAAAPTTVRLRIVPTGTVNVCLVSGVSGKVLIDSQNLETGATTRVFAAKRLKVTFGNGSASMRIGKRTYDVPDTANGIGYDLRPGRKPAVLSATERPSCT